MQLCLLHPREKKIFTTLYVLHLILCNSFCTYSLRFLTCTSWRVINYPIVYLLKAFWKCREWWKSFSLLSRWKCSGLYFSVVFKRVMPEFEHKEPLSLHWIQNLSEGINNKIITNQESHFKNFVEFWIFYFWKDIEDNPLSLSYENRLPIY